MSPEAIKAPPATAPSVKWWHWCIAAAVLVAFLYWLSQRTFLQTQGQTYSQTISAGTTPVIEDEAGAHAPAAGAPQTH